MSGGAFLWVDWLTKGGTKKLLKKRDTGECTFFCVPFSGVHPNLYHYSYSLIGLDCKSEKINQATTVEFF